jgi:hypothetical protein
MNFSRYWVNQPSELQQGHRFHGRNVIANLRDSDGMPHLTRVYFAEGSVISATLRKDSLSPGWRPSLEENLLNSIADALWGEGADQDWNADTLDAIADAIDTLRPDLITARGEGA